MPASGFLHRRLWHIAAIWIFQKQPSLGRKFKDVENFLRRRGRSLHELSRASLVSSVLLWKSVKEEWGGAALGVAVCGMEGAARGAERCMFGGAVVE